MTRLSHYRNYRNYRTALKSTILSITFTYRTYEHLDKYIDDALSIHVLHAEVFLEE